MAFNEKILEAKANKFRRELGLGTETSIDLEKLLLTLGVLTVFKPLESEFSGMALKTNENLFMLINSALPVGRQNFTIGHEIYHLFIQSDFNFQMCNAGKFDKKDREEYNADIFSSYFLMPEAALIKQIPEKELGWGETISLATLIKMEQYFGVSRAALLVRMSKSKYIHYEDYKHYLKGVIKSAVEHGYSAELYQRNDEEKVVGDYGTKVKALFDIGKISESHYHSLMLDIGLDIDDPKFNDYGKEN
ncbi:ImmA/IrrE family metallo-endopeptidase [Flavobacterium sp. HNIBRBA15423]|uniref:ImmA/IrrE family metallo-endopeptidase n=1 Tax=Flavobacterium sp. HNIBRBA15423 TaxID=3458683 RepID=UPI004043AC74